MKVFVAGASGRVGQEVVKELLAAGHTVTAGARHLDAVDDRAEKVAMDLHASVDDLAKLIDGNDAVFFTAGSRGKDLLQVDLNGSVKLQEAAKKVGAKRFVQLSSTFALEQDKWASVPALASIMDYNVAKFYADRWLIDHPGLDWTIVQPGILEERAATGTVAINDGGYGRNAIPDVAKVLAGSLAHDNTVGKVLMMHDGDRAIDEALGEA